MATNPSLGSPDNDHFIAMHSCLVQEPKLTDSQVYPQAKSIHNIKFEYFLLHDLLRLYSSVLSNCLA